MKSDHKMEILEVNHYRVLYLQHDSYLSNIQFLTDVGSAAEESSIEGMAHILEHMFFKGSTKRQGGTAISRAANDIGGKLNAYTTYDHTVYYMTMLSDRFREGLDILADMYQNPLFPPEEFAKELNPILSEFREREDDPENFLMERALEKCLGTIYHPVIGNEKTIRASTAEKMHAFKKRFYGGSNCLISVTGGIDKATLISGLEEVLVPANDTEKPIMKAASFTPGELKLSKPGIKEAYCYRLYPALSPDHPDRYKQDMMNYILGGNDSALLYERVREELGMSCYGIYSWIMRYEPFSILTISCGIDPAQLDQLDREVNDQIKKIMDSPVEESMLNRARASLRTSIAARSETSSGLGGMVSVPILKGEKDHPVEKALEQIRLISAEDVMEQARSTFAGEPFRAVLLPE